MKKAKVVIGANYGDEGKGLVTDYLSAQTGRETLVVRFNGGAQAGHTVVTPDGRRHVFSHFGSGSFNGCATYLSRFFVCNPLVFFRELTELQKKDAYPLVYIDPLAQITTPFDMMINQCVEEWRGKGRHGSCGLGFGETIERNLRPAFQLTFADLFVPDQLKRKLEAIRNNWVPLRLSALGLKEIPDVWKVTFGSPYVVDRFMGDIEIFLKQVQCAPTGLLSDTEHLVFEGAQGLLLDQDYGAFPNVTRSNTGLKNVITLATESGITMLEPHYLTRSYMTRHGAGPLQHEVNRPLYQKIVDPTNITNKFQGALRFAPLDIDLVSRSIRSDLKYCPPTLQVSPVLFVGCMDQIDASAVFIKDGKHVNGDGAAFLAAIKTTSGLKKYLTCYGPTREDVRVQDARTVSSEIEALTSNLTTLAAQFRKESRRVSASAMF